MVMWVYWSNKSNRSTTTYFYNYWGLPNENCSCIDQKWINNSNEITILPWICTVVWRAHVTVGRSASFHLTTSMWIKRRYHSRATALNTPQKFHVVLLSSLWFNRVFSPAELLMTTCRTRSNNTPAEGPTEGHMLRKYLHTRDTKLKTT